LAATTGAGAQIALMNPFGIRASLVPAADGSVTFGDIYRVQPFANPLITMTLTGAELKAVLEQGLDDDGPVQALSPSAGFTYAYMMSRPAGDRIVAIGLNGQGIDPAARYRVTVNGFLAQGGDGFTGFAGKPDTVTGPLDLDAMETWLKGDSARAVPQERRVEMLAPL
ncbi:MAG: 5'-nucleotidase, partial [Novosphingobium sp.]